MSVELRDLRAKVNPETDLALEAFSKADGIDKSELVRIILGSWAKKRIHASNVLQNALQREGLARGVEG